METSEANPVAAPAANGPGSVLSGAREALDISRREMADRLNWIPAYVIALEENRFDVLPSNVFARGYLRAYAKQVGVDEVALLEVFEAYQAANEQPLETPRRLESRIIPQVQRKGWALPAGIAIVFMLLLVLWLMRGEEESVQTPPAVNIDMTAEQVRIDASVDDSSVEALPQDSEAMQSVEIAPTSDIVEAESDVAVETAGESLAFSFSGECWLEVRDANNELIYADLRVAGDELNLRGVAPFSILVGDWRYVELYFEGELVEIKTRPGRVIARFDVGAP